MQQLTAHDRVRIAAQAIVSPRTVARVYDGHGTDYSRARIRAAARALGLPPPPELQTKQQPASADPERAA